MSDDKERESYINQIVTCLHKWKILGKDIKTTFTGKKVAVYLLSCEYCGTLIKK